MTKTKRPNIIGIVLAGGYGKRLFGPSGGSKCLFAVDAIPLIEYSLLTICEAKIDEIVLIGRDDDSELPAKYSNHLIISTAANGTLSAVLEAARYAVGKEASALISSCDLVCAPSTGKDLIDALEINPDWDASIGITTIANDDNPIWVRSNDQGIVLDYGKGIPPSDAAFASIRFASLNFLKLMLKVSEVISEEIDTDTKLMRHIITSTQANVGAIDIGHALDVDNTLDAEIATGISRTWKKR